MEREKRKVLSVLVGLLVLIGAGIWFYGGIEPPAAVTVQRMAAVETGVRAFYAAEGRLPVSLEHLGTSGHYDGEIVDGWNKLLRYELVDERTVTVTSLGADEKEGGMMFKKDRAVTVVVD